MHCGTAIDVPIMALAYFRGIAWHSPGQEIRRPLHDGYKVTQSLLLVSYYCPSRGHAGGLRLLDLYREIRRLAPTIRIELLTGEHPAIDWGCEGLEAIFDAIYRVRADHFGPGLIDRLPPTTGSFDLIDLQYHPSGAQIGACRKRWPKASIVYSPMESMIRFVCMDIRRLRIGRHAFLGNVLRALQEISYIREADSVTFVSGPDLDACAFLKNRRFLHCVPTGLSEYEFPDGKLPFARLDNSVIVFSAFFGSLTNREALKWFCRYVHPALRKKFPDYIFRVVGRGLDEELLRVCAGDGIEFVGQVDVISEILQHASIGIAPALSGSGVRGKIHQYSAMGLPCVASTLAGEGLTYVPGESILLARNAAEFIEQCAKLLNDANFRKQIGDLARDVVTNNYRWGRLAKSISHAYGLEG
jgi:glycosyltransferase involved in cell wall biosynthesis